MRVLVSGASGLIGRALVRSLQGDGHEVVRLVRPSSGSLGGGKAADTRVPWDVGKASIDAQGLEGLDAVVHLAGENIASGRWTDARKRRIRDSRVEGTKLLAGALARLERRPHVMVSASAVGFYGNRGDEELHEGSAMGEGFLAEVCRDWEAATRDAVRAGIRVVQLRSGLVLSGEGGALKLMLLPFRLGLGGRLGDGRQFTSWISRDDAVGVIRHLLDHDEVAGPVNGVAPQPVTNREFTATLARVLRRPAILPVPAPLLRVALGELANELMASVRAVPKRLRESGYAFRHPTLEDALRAVLRPS